MNKAMHICHLCKCIQQQNSHILGPDGRLQQGCLVIHPAPFYPLHRDHPFGAQLQCHNSLQSCEGPHDFQAAYSTAGEGSILGSYA